jgi:Xaa-Pro dipeptidase
VAAAADRAAGVPGGMRHAAYTAICGCGPNAAVLHYGHAGAPNNRTLTAEEVVLNDMGCEYYCYASDITCSFPVSGTFSPAQRGIYEAVLDSSIKTAQAAGPGKSWVELHKLSTRVIAEHLIRLGYLHGTLDDVVAAGVDDLFMPHGLGHLMGIDTHDVGGIPPGVEKFKALRMNRELLPGMVLTIEPGCYFIPAVLEPAFKDEAKAKHLDEAKIRGMFGFGGVRIEDNLVVTDAGLELLTAVPRTIKEVEAVMAGADFPLPDSDYPLKRPNVAGSGLPVWTPAPAAPAAAPAGGAKRARK